MNDALVRYVFVFNVILKTQNNQKSNYKMLV